MSSEFTNFNRSENWLSIFIGEGGFADQTSMPDGNYPPVAWRMPLKGGSITSRSRVIGTSSFVSTGNLGYQIIATLTGTGEISNALGTLIVNLIASISGTGEISDAAMQAFLFAVAELVGTGEISDAELLGIGELIALLEGEGLIDPLLTGRGAMSCDIKSYGELSVEGLRDAVWTAVADRYTDNTTMGGKVNAAAVGGVDYEALANAVLDAILTGHDTTNSVAKILKDINRNANLIPAAL
jgi:hypothetical protein